MMRKYAQILYDKAHWIFEQEEEPDFAPDIVLVDITDKPDVKEGWDYNDVTGEFTEPEPFEPIEPEPSPIELLQVENAQLWHDSMLKDLAIGSNMEEAAELWHENMMLDTKLNDETAALWYELMLGEMQ